MADRPTIVERAYELAMTGNFRTISEIAVVLRKERYDHIGPTFQGLGLRRELKRLMARTKAKRPAAAEGTVSEARQWA